MSEFKDPKFHEETEAANLAARRGEITEEERLHKYNAASQRMLWRMDKHRRDERPGLAGLFSRLMGR